MGKHDRCSVGGCSNDKRYPDKYVKRGHVEKLIFHRFPVDPVKKEKWVIAVQKGRKHFRIRNMLLFLISSYKVKKVLICKHQACVAGKGPFL